MPGPIVHINRFKDITLTKCGTSIDGLTSVSYALSREVNTFFTTGSAKSVADYGSLPDIEISYTGYANAVGGFDLNEANSASELTIRGKNGGVSCAKALLSSVSYNMSINEPFTITKSYKGYVKPVSGGGGSSTLIPFTIKRWDYTGGLPPGFEGNHLQKVSVDISIDRQYIGEFATRKPYASVVTYPMKQSMTFELLSDSLDSVVIDNLYNACENPESTKYAPSIGACGIGYSLSNAYITAINYGGGEAQRNGSPQTISVTYTSYDSIDGIKPVLILDEIQSCV